MSDVLIRKSEVSEVLNELGSGFANDVADIIKKDGIKSVQHAVVSSQFDADRLDYMRRDRMMTGTQHAAIDFRWLIANLEIGPVATGVDERPVGTVETFVLGPKAIYAAEAYVLGLFQLYPTIYYHKATRGAENIFTELLIRVVTLVRDGMGSVVGLTGNHPLVRFANNAEDFEVALTLDDTVVWGALTQMGEATDPLVREFATRLRDRKLYKCKDIRMEVTHALDPKSVNTDGIIENIDKCCAGIGAKLAEWIADNCKDRPRILLDDAERSPYKPIGKSKGPLDRINVSTDGGILVDKLFRAYVDGNDSAAQDAVPRIVEGEIEACRTRTQ
jgi:hypothetical protein